MTVRIVAQQFPASGLINLEPGNYFFCISSPPAGYGFQTWGKSGSENYGSSTSLIAPVGLKVARIRGWTQAQLYGTSGQSITYVYGAEVIAPQDITDILS